MSANASFVAREAERMAQNSSGRQAMILNQLAVGCMVAMALPAIFQSVGVVFKGIEGIFGIGHDIHGLTHVQRLNMERVGRKLDERSMWAGDRRR